MSGMTSRRVEKSDLEAFIVRVFQACGVPEDDAHEVAQLIAEADLIGADAHGVFRLPQYVKRIQVGGINTHPVIAVESERAAMADCARTGWRRQSDWC